MTQWIFRQDLCQCAQPKIGNQPQTKRQDDTLRDGSALLQDSSALLRDGSALLANGNTLLSEEDGAELDVADFPSERYKPFRVIGSGANSDIYLSSDKVLNKLVAVKMLRQLSAEQLIAFQKEAKATSVLAHHNIVKVLDFGASASGAPYMVLEYFRGRGLDVYLREQKTMPWREALELTLQLCDALANAHSHNIFHRDIKPANVLVRRKNEGGLDVKLIDFGIARVRQPHRDPTIPAITSVIGTPTYMSPEQAQDKHAGAPSEIYSLGCVLYECIRGRPPFFGESALAILNQHASVPPPSLLDDRSIDVPNDVERLVQKCLAKNVDERFQSMKELEEEIRTILRSMLTAPSTLSEEEEDSSGHRPLAVLGNRTQFALLICGAISLGLLAFAILSFDKETKPKPPVEDQVFIGKADSEFEGMSDALGTREARKSARVYRDPSLLTPTLPKRTVRKKPQSAEDKISGQHGVQLWDPSLNLTKTRVNDNMLAAQLDPSLKAIFVSASPITDESLKRISECKSLNVLSVSETNITNDGLALLATLPNLLYLNINGCRVTDDGMKHVGKMTSLKTLRIMDTSITGDGIRHLLTLSHLNDIDVGRSKTGNGIAALRALKDLEILRIGSSGVTDEGIRALLPMPNLKALHAQQNPITGKALKYIAQLPELNDLWLNETKVKGKDLKALASMHLGTLRLSGLDVDDNCINDITRLETLHSLSVSETKITDRGLSKIAKLPNLRMLDITGCNQISEEAIAELQHRRKPRIQVKYAAAE